MSSRYDTMIRPPIEELLERAESKFRLVTLGSKRARQINSYFGQLGEGLGASIPPQVTSVSRKPLSIALEEIVADVKRRLDTCTLPVKISVLGCAVNGPGEAKEADIGIAGGAGKGLLFRKGKTVRKVREDEIVDALIEEIAELERERAEANQSGEAADASTPATSSSSASAPPAGAAP